ncbi:MAG: DinB family protein [Candidatus Hodarchaeota archaeon]
MGLENLAKYHYWVGEKTRKILMGLTDEEFKKNLGEILGNIQTKVEHIIFALLTCFNTLDMNLEYFEDTFEKTIQKIQSFSKKELLACWKDLDNILVKTLDENLVGTVSILRRDSDSFCLKREDFLLQYVLHTVYHRGQLNYCLRALKKNRIEGDYLFYFDEIDKCLDQNL